MTESQGDHSPASSVTSDDDKEEEFSAVLSVLNKNNLPLLGSAVLQRTKPQDGTVVTNPSVGEPLYGSFHVLFPLTFDDGLRWLVKIPIDGTDDKWDDLAAASLVSEANTMRLLKRETTIPLPEVLDFSSSTQNLIGCPYILIEFVSGIRLRDLRLNATGPSLTRERHVRVLKGIASAMSQLNKYSFQQGGSPVFGDSGDIEGIGPSRVVDRRASLEQCFSDEDADDREIFVACEASSDILEPYTSMLDECPASDPADRALEMILRQMVSRIPVPNEKQPFVLAHPDFQDYNVIVSEDGQLVSIIDWDGVNTVPRSLGNERYPGWLITDWEGYSFEDEESTEKEDTDSDGVGEDSPETLSYYRDIYNNLMTEHRARMGREPEPNFTRMSLITQNLAAACGHVMFRLPILQKISHESWIAAGGEDELNVLELAESLVDDETKSEATERLGTVMRGFDMLLVKSGL